MIKLVKAFILNTRYLSLAITLIRYRHTGESRTRSEAFQRYPCGDPNNPATGLRRYDASRFPKGIRSI
jgi:hypothetical protein